MPILDELKAAGVNIEDWQAVINYVGQLRTPRDRREGLLRLAARAKNRVPTLADIEQVRSAPSP